MAERIHTIKLVQAWNSVYISKIIDAFLLYIAMSLSQHLVGNMMVGGAFYLCGQVLVVFFFVAGKHVVAVFVKNVVILRVTAAL